MTVINMAVLLMGIKQRINLTSLRSIVNLEIEQGRKVGERGLNRFHRNKATPTDFGSNTVQKVHMRK